MMQINNLTWTHWIKQHEDDLNESFVQKIQILPSYDLRIKVRSPKTGNHTFIIAKDRIFETRLDVAVTGKPHGFTTFLKKHIEGKKIAQVYQHEWDKVIVIAFRDYDLIVELFSNGNVILCDKKGIILQPYHREEWKDRTIQKGETYQFPQSPLLDWSKRTIKEFNAVLPANENLAKALILHSGISPSWADDAVEYLKIKNPLTPPQQHELFTFIQNWAFTPVRPALVTKKEKWLVPFLVGHQTGTLMEGLDAALEADYVQQLGEEASPKQTAAKSPKRQTLALTRAREEQEKAATNFEEKIKEYQLAAQMILANQPEIDELLQAIQEAQKKRVPLTEIEKKLSDAKKAEKRGARLIQSMQLKQRKIIIEL